MQRPLATVVIGGILSSTFLTLVLLPVLYRWVMSWQTARTPARRKVSQSADDSESIPDHAMPAA